MEWVKILGLIVAILLSVYNTVKDWESKPDDSSARATEVSESFSPSVVRNG